MGSLIEYDEWSFLYIINEKKTCWTSRFMQRNTMNGYDLHVAFHPLLIVYIFFIHLYFLVDVEHARCRQLQTLIIYPNCAPIHLTFNAILQLPSTWFWLIFFFVIARTKNNCSFNKNTVLFSFENYLVFCLSTGISRVHGFFFLVDDVQRSVTLRNISHFSVLKTCSRISSI